VMGVRSMGEVFCLRLPCCEFVIHYFACMLLTGLTSIW